MASTDIDGTKLMILGEGQGVTLVMGDLSYRGTLALRVDGFTENWYIKLDGYDGEIEIHKRERAAAPKSEFCGLESLHPAHEYDGRHCPGSEHLTQGK